MTDTAKLREALEGDLGMARVAVREYIALLESSDIILIRKVDGEWPEEARAVLKSFLWGGNGYTFNSILDALADSLAKESS